MNLIFCFYPFNNNIKLDFDSMEYVVVIIPEVCPHIDDVWTMTCQLA